MNFQTNKYFRISGLLSMLAIALVSGCKPSSGHDGVPEDTPDTLRPVPLQVADSTLWGHMGEDTGMSALQFITDQGDTMEVYRTSPYSGRDGTFFGEVRNYTDRFALTLCEGNETLLTAINVTQLAQTWVDGQSLLTLHPNGSASTEGLSYEGWRLWNGRLLLSGTLRHENGMTSLRTDTMQIIRLDADSLVLLTPMRQTLTFGFQPPKPNTP